MNLTNLRRLAYLSFNKKNLRRYFTITFIIKGFVIALLLSAFIYLAHFELYHKVLITVLSFSGFFILINANRYEYFWFGFFLAIFWFWWIGLSTRYYDTLYLMPFVILFISLIYAFIFGFIGLFSNQFLRALMIFGTSYLYPFGFNWLQLELNLLDSFINSHESSYFAFMLALAFLSKFKAKRINLAFATALFIYSLFPHHINTQKPAKIYIQKPNLLQEQKWKPQYKQSIVDKNFKDIDEAIKNGYDIVLLHESAYPMYLNQNGEILQKLIQKSYQIPIVTGALSLKNGKTYNSSYFFNEGKYQIANKVVLVPFGESIPLPNWAKNIINDIFFNGADDYETDKNPTDFLINGTYFRNAICYEATSKKLYKGSPKHMLVLSNNAWFTPSIEPTLQHLLLRLYAQRNGTIIYHSANIDKSGIIIPK